MAFDPQLIIGWFCIFLFSVSIHEAAHAWMAKIGGDLTAYKVGQVSLNPIPHIKREPFGMLVLPIVSVIIMNWPFGYASTPYDQKWAEKYPKYAGLMALAGPLTNLFIAFVCLLTMWVGLKIGVFKPQLISIVQIVSTDEAGTARGLSILLSMLLTMNFLLFVINILPVPPLDGSGIPPMFMKQAGAKRYNEIINQPFLGIIGIFIVWNLIGYIFFPAYRFFLQILL